jgi:hypothetical protein
LLFPSHEKTSEHTTDIGALQKAADFVKAFSLGFEVADALAMLRMEDIFIESFAIEDGALKMIILTLSQNSPRGQLSQSSWENCRKGWEDQVHHRKCYANAYRTC